MVPPIVWLIIVGVIATTISMGSLMPAISNLNLQGVSINERDFSAPLTTANVDIDITPIQAQNEFGQPIIKNRITECSFHTPSNNLGPGSKVICKLTDHNDRVVAEGSMDFPNGLAPSVDIKIPIEKTAFDNANEAQNIDDIKIIILGPNPSRQP